MSLEIVSNSISARHLMEQMPVKMVVTDKRGVINFSTKPFIDSCGFHKMELQGISMSRIFKFERDLEDIETIVKQTVSGNHSTISTFLCCKSSRQIPCELKFSPYRNEMEEIVGMLCVVKDKSQSESQISNELLKQELIQIKKELEQFSYIISHDLKAPLRAIKNLSNWIFEDHGHLLNESGKKQLELLNNRVERLHSLIEGVLRYSRVGRFVKPSSEVDLNFVVNRIIQKSKLAENCQIELQENLPLLFIDEIRITEVFEFLIENALFFRKTNGNHKINIGWNYKSPYLEFFISDNGIGIRDKDFERVFKIFQTVNAGPDQLGLGLTLSKRIVNYYNGKIWLESDQEAGITTVFFTIPDSLLIV